MGWTLSEVPDTLSEPLTLQAVKDHLRVTHDLDDGLITTMLASAREYVEVMIQANLATRDYVWSRDTAPITAELCLPVWPVQSVVITYYDADNAGQTFAAANYETLLTARPALLRLVSGASWPLVYDRYDALTITITAGFLGGDLVLPVRALQVIQLLVADLYEHREAEVEARVMHNKIYERLFWSIREVSFA